jgi:hypothetical protein
MITAMTASSTADVVTYVCVCVCERELRSKEISNPATICLIVASQDMDVQRPMSFCVQ